MTNITSGSVLSANIRVNNFSDTDKTYDISADVSIVNNPNEYGDGQIQNGSVSLDGKTLATWSHHSNLSIQYLVEDADTQSNILQEVQLFIGSILVFRANAQLSALTPPEE